MNRTDEELAIAAQCGDQDAHRELVDRHRGLLVTMVRQDFRSPSVAVFESLLGAGEQAYWDAVATYKPAVGGPVRLWMASNARWAMVDAARAACRAAKKRAELEEMWPPSPSEALVNSRLAKLPDERMRVIATERLSPWAERRPTQAELMARLDVGQQQVSRLEMKTRSLLREMNVAWRKSEEPVTAWPCSATSTECGRTFTVRLRFQTGAPAIVKCFRSPRARTCNVRAIRARQVEAANVVEMTEEEKEVMRRLYERGAA